MYRHYTPQTKKVLSIGSVAYPPFCSLSRYLYNMLHLIVLFKEIVVEIELLMLNFVLMNLGCVKSISCNLNWSLRQKKTRNQIFGFSTPL